MRIAFSTSGAVEHEDYKSGDVLGTEYQVFGLSKEIVQRGHEVYIVRKWYDGLKEEKIRGVKIINVTSPNLIRPTIGKAINQVIFSKYAAKAIRQIEPDILNLTGKYSSYGLYNLGIPSVHTTHSVPMDLLPKDLVPFRGIFGCGHPTKWLESKIYDNCDAIVALNEKHRLYLSSRGFKVVFIPNGVDIENYIPNHSDEGYIYFTGRLVKQKRVDYLINAYSMLGRKLQKQFELVIGGFGPEKEKLEKAALKSKLKSEITFIPWLSKLDQTKKIGNCSIYVLPSLFEGLPVALLEAMAFGKPVVASNIPGIQEVITHGKDGFLFENISELKKCLERLLEDAELRKRIGENARKTVEEKYTFEKVTDSYLNLYEELLGADHGK